MSCNAPPIILAVLGLLKSSSTLGVIQTISRVLLSLFPFVWAKARIMKFMTTFVDFKAHPHLLERHSKHMISSQWLQTITVGLLALPLSLIGITALASSERTPLTGRWRVILLSPAEEECIAADLKGERWYKTVMDVMAQASPDGRPPTVIATSDWRFTWVEETLRRLERAVVSLHNTAGYRVAYQSHLQANSANSAIYPPPPNYPLLPRGRASGRLHSVVPHSDYDHTDNVQQPSAHTHHVPPHTLLGPPYSLLMVEKDEPNAFSYGFGPEGSGGIVLYSGFLDEVLGDAKVSPPISESSLSQSKTGWSSFLFAQSPPADVQPRHPQPTAEQTSKLATLLAHELSHLVLSHHIETLSKGSILFPSVIAIAADTVRSLLYPITFLAGPFIGDALDRTLRLSFDDLAKAGEACTNTTLEIEADAISARILALAGFDPQAAINFWDDRMQNAQSSKKVSTSPTYQHPPSQERVEALKNELTSWASYRDREIRHLAHA